MRISYKLLLTLLIAGVASVVVTGVIGYESGKRGLTQAVMNQLTGVRRSKAYQIESYLGMIRSHVRTLSQNRMFVDAVQEFRGEFRKLDGPTVPAATRAAVVAYYLETFLPSLNRLMPQRERPEEQFPVTSGAYYLQWKYIVSNPEPPGRKKILEDAGDGSGYSRVHARYHRSLSKLVEEFGYYDLFLVSADTGQIVYTVQKEVDFGRNLMAGTYSQSGLAQVVRQARSTGDPDAVFLSDFESYGPSLGAPAAFIASPIVDSTRKVVGVLAIQLANRDIDNVISGNQGWEHDGLGKTGDSGIIGPDYLMRSNARIFLQEPERAMALMKARGVPQIVMDRIRAYNTTVLQQEVKLPSVKAALAGQEATAIQISSSGRESLISYAPLRIFGLHWTIASRLDTIEALAPVAKFRNDMILWTLLVFAAMVAAALLMTRAIVRPVNRLVAAARRLASGDMSTAVPVDSKDELGLLSRTFNDMVTSIREKTETIEHKNAENERLLLSILPGPIAARLKAGENKIADNFAHVTVLFADLVGFTQLAGTVQPGELVELLNRLFTRFDHAAERNGVEKIKTIGDAYMAVAGLPTPFPDHARRLVDLALDMLDEVQSFNREFGVSLALRIGVNSGPVVAGVIGSSKFIYDLWGDTVNVASRMESHGVPGMIQATRAVYEQLAGQHDFAARGLITIKGKGAVETWLLRSREHAAVEVASAQR
jgi:class 3 adenylate cyclase/HAMP domain-containing protein